MKPNIPKGTRDFLPEEMAKRTYLFETIKHVFRLYGYLPVETTSIENIDTLMGKYGEEGDRLIFKILNSGDILADLKDKDINTLTGKELSRLISEKALRYDLTVPFARFVAMNRNELTFPFKRYQIQPVWRADRPQKGRYREFYQCDADVIGSTSLLNEVELIKMIDDVFVKLKIPVIIKINHRKLLMAIAENAGILSNFTEVITSIDKIEKNGYSAVKEELISKGFTDIQIFNLFNLFTVGGDSFDEQIAQASLQIPNNNLKLEGIRELELIAEGLKHSRISNTTSFDVKLARGLNYYTGTIIEVKVDSTKCKSQFNNSIAGGGRYDNLTDLFGLPGVSGVGISFGADRIYDVLKELNLFPAGLSVCTQVMFINFGKEREKKCLEWIDALHKAGISAELYPDNVKFKKQMGYADAKKVAFVVFAGDDEVAKNAVKIKNMVSGEENEIKDNQITDYFLK